MTCYFTQQVKYNKSTGTCMWRVIEKTPQCRERQLVLGYPENAELAPRRACRSVGSDISVAIGFIVTSIYGEAVSDSLKPRFTFWKRSTKIRLLSST